jgi:hypothetical protein
MVSSFLMQAVMTTLTGLLAVVRLLTPKAQPFEASRFEFSR